MVLLFRDADFWITVGQIYYRQSLGCVYERRDRSCSFPFLSFPCPSASRYLARFAWSTLPLSRANICRYTLKRSEKRRRDTLAKFGIPTNLSSTNIRLLVCRERPCVSLPPYRVPSSFIGDFYDFFVEFLRVLLSFPCCSIIHLVKRLLTEGDPSEVDPLCGSWICKIWIKGEMVV